jgi:hypothetical protein
LGFSDKGQVIWTLDTIGCFCNYFFKILSPKTGLLFCLGMFIIKRQNDVLTLRYEIE